MTEIWPLKDDLLSFAQNRCSICGIGLDIKNIDFHIAAHHPNHRYRSIEGTIFRCTCNKRKFKSFKQLTIHFLKLHSNIQPTFLCKFCKNRKFFFEKDLADHLVELVIKK